MTVSDGGSYVNGGAEAAESSTPSLDDGDIHVCQDGPHDSPALLLIHGSASSTRSWNPMVPLLTGAHRVIRIDLLGHGRSAKPADGSYAIADQARRAGVALDRLGVEHAVVVGHSSGGVVATALAEQRPDLVTALALVNTGPSLDASIVPESAAAGLAVAADRRTAPADREHGVQPRGLPDPGRAPGRRTRNDPAHVHHHDGGHPLLPGTAVAA